MNISKTSTIQKTEGLGVSWQPSKRWFLCPPISPPANTVISIDRVNTEGVSVWKEKREEKEISRGANELEIVQG
jgi:hypothetical protein